MIKNMNMLDRRLRALVVAPAAIVIGIVIGPGSAAAVVLYVVAAVMLLTSATGFCPLYTLLRRRGHGHGHHLAH